MANPNMTDHVYSTAPQAVSRYLASQGLTRSRTVRGRLVNYRTTGFQVCRIFGETQVSYVVDCRESRDVKSGLWKLAKALKGRYEVVLKGEVLIVSEKILKPEGLSFYPRKDVLGKSYRAETEAHRYVIRCIGKGEWQLQVFSLVDAGSAFRPFMVADEYVSGSIGRTKADMIDAAHEFLKKQSA